MATVRSRAAPRLGQAVRPRPVFCVPCPAVSPAGPFVLSRAALFRVRQAGHVLRKRSPGTSSRPVCPAGLAPLVDARSCDRSACVLLCSCVVGLLGTHLCLPCSHVKLSLASALRLSCVYKSTCSNACVGRDLARPHVLRCPNPHDMDGSWFAVHMREGIRHWCMALIPNCRAATARSPRSYRMNSHARLMMPIKDATKSTRTFGGGLVRQSPTATACCIPLHTAVCVPK